ncbi:unnamed protein product [Paramecium octaurelia]|uniref:Uncharacterized protein n=1 Tax=Paramecium octaurelia TaxID=43137 RepID=A0A8S1YDI9_PAROT|nr:unnamed protein product [Paramecium octaurelia]
MDNVNSCLMMLNGQSTEESECPKDELNDSIDLYMDSKINAIEIRIVKYLHGMGIQTKTDPGQKEQQYWSSKRLESNKKLELFWSDSNLPMNSPLIRLLKSRQSQTFQHFGQSAKSIQDFGTY